MEQRNNPGGAISSDRFMKPVPGWSLTQSKGKWPWDNPPRQTDPDAVVETIIEKLKDERTEEKYVKLMFAGVSIEEIVHSISVAGFMNGEFSPDVAEIIKPAIGIYLMGVATDFNVPVKVFADEEALRDEMDGMDDGTLLDIMQKRNPQFAQHVMEFEDPEVVQRMEREQKMSEGFLAVEAPMEDIEEMEDIDDGSY